MKANKKDGKQIPVEYLEGDKNSSEEKIDPENLTDNGKQEISPSEDLAEQDQELKLKYEELNNQFLRLRAEFVNFRKRVEKEKVEFSNFLKSEMIKRMLPVVDDFKNMLDKTEEGSNDVSVVEGARMIYDKLYQVLEAEGLSKIEALGKEFDPLIHEAMMVQNTEEKKQHNKVLTVFQDGFLLGERLVRPARAVVGNYQEPEEKN